MDIESGQAAIVGTICTNQKKFQAVFSADQNGNGVYV